MENLIVLFRNVKVSDFLDISVLSYVIYQFLIVIRGTRAVQMTFGVVGIFFLYWVSLHFQLNAINWVLTSFIDNFFLILVILFQDNFRNALSTVGELKLTRLLRRASEKTELNEVVEACRVLCKEKIGALIVLERKNGLANYTTTGTTLQALVKSDLIYSIFQTQSPLHDGAIIIKDNIILAAGCLLPLTKNSSIDRHYGTRHRAALGLSEMTDALVIIISEERSEIKLGHKGKFYLMKDSLHLADTLAILESEDEPQQILEEME